ncbi:MAG: hypothetical protein ACK2UY_00515 [Anaerolineae bacterium]
MIDAWPEITYEEARAAFQAGQKLHKEGRIFLVRPALREQGEPVLWITDQETTGDRGLLLFPDGSVQSKP